jgi:hypothetical protein
MNPELPEQSGKRTVCRSAGFLLYDPLNFVNSLKNEEIRQSGFFPSFSEKFRRLKDFLGSFFTSQWNEPLQQANSLNKDLLPSSHHGTLSLAVADTTASSAALAAAEFLTVAKPCMNP